MRQEIDWKVTGMQRPMRIGKRKSVRPLINTMLAIVGIFGGISAMFIGLIFVICHAVWEADVVFNTAGTVLLIAAIPMLLIGSVFADATERKDD